MFTMTTVIFLSQNLIVLQGATRISFLSDTALAT